MKSPILPTGNPLLDDALDDAYREDLEKGNLGKKKAPEPSLSPSWKSLGYWAHVDCETCNACGSVSFHLVGVFLREQNLSNTSAVRSTRLNLRAFRNLNIEPQSELIEVTIDLCAECVFVPLTSSTK